MASNLEINQQLNLLGSVKFTTLDQLGLPISNDRSNTKSESNRIASKKK